MFLFHLLGFDLVVERYKSKMVRSAPMPTVEKLQRIRDPLHNLIEFRAEKDPFERTLWRVIQTRPFQRLRRVRQLGFSEFVFPGATHSRFAHSVGVFHIARYLMDVVLRHTGEETLNHKAQVALAAALVHDVGHGMFSHVFEDIGKKLNLPMARHENVSERLIRSGEIAQVFKKEMGSGFAKDVANVVKGRPGNLYESVVSSQFDADRLDYMQRDRLMTGVQSSGIDATWLIANLEIGEVQASADKSSAGKVETLVLGPKAFHAAENYVLSLFQLYPNVYMHKTTKAAEKLFTCLIMRVLDRAKKRVSGSIGLPKNHPIRRFAEDPATLENALALDDTVLWGALPMMIEAKDSLIRGCAKNLHERRLPKCIDIRHQIDLADPIKPGMSSADRREREARVSLRCKQIVRDLGSIARERKADEPQILIDEDSRRPYKDFQESKTMLNQILLKRAENDFEDMANLSAVVRSAETFEVCRAYYFDDDSVGKSLIQNTIRTKIGQKVN